MEASRARSERVAVVNGARLRYLREGTGAPLVLVHAGIADSRMWEPQMGPLAAAGFTVVAPDLRGFGGSPMVAGPYRHRDDLRSLLAALGMRPSVLVGCSRGARAVLDLALAEPGLARALVLVSPSVGGFIFAGPDPPQVAAIDEADRRGDLEEVNRLEVAMWVAGPKRQLDGMDPAIVALALEMNRRALSAPAIGEELALEEDAAHRLDEVTAPVLVVTGADDVPRTLAAARHLVAHLPRAEAVTIPDAAHLPGLERPGPFNAALLGFLARHRSVAG